MENNKCADRSNYNLSKAVKEMGLTNNLPTKKLNIKM
jgi:hypothetical protein